MKISVSALKETNAKAYKTFYPVEATDEELKTIITTKVWSPIIFKDLHRRKISYESCELLAFDFDNGKMTVDMAIDLIKNWDCYGVIGTTKSHQKEKTSTGGKTEPACDRFRLVLKAFSACTDWEQYEYNMSQFFKKLPCDRSCKDAARFFYPCTEIVFSQNGNPIDWVLLPEGFMREPERKAEAAQNILMHRNNGTVPDWVTRRLTHGAKQGDRHRFCYAIGLELTEIGYTTEEIIAAVMGGPLSEIGADDVREAVWYGARKARGGTESFGSAGKIQGQASMDSN